MKKEQLCSNASSTRGWKRNPPPYIDHFDVWVEYSNKVVAMPSLFPLLSPFGKATSIDCSRGDLQVEEDVLLRVHAMLPSDADIVPLLKITEWKSLFPSLDPLKWMRLLGRLGMRIMGITHFLHWELRQSVEAYFGFVLQSFALGDSH